MTNVGRSTETWLNGTSRTGRSEGKVLDLMTKVAKGSEVMDLETFSCCLSCASCKIHTSDTRNAKETVATRAY